MKLEHITSVAVALCTAAIVGVGSWVWSSQAKVVLLIDAQKRTVEQIEKLYRRTEDRYPRAMAVLDQKVDAEDRRSLLCKIHKIELALARNGIK